MCVLQRDDDGIATGATMLASIGAAKAKGAKKVVVAVPVLTKEALDKIKPNVDNVVCLDIPAIFWGVGGFYKDFGQTEDKEVIDLMEKSKDFGKSKK